MDTLTKVAVVAVVASLTMLGAATFINEVDPGDVNPILVRYKDGQMPVDDLYTFRVSNQNLTYYQVSIACPMVGEYNAQVTINLLLESIPDDKGLEKLNTDVCNLLNKSVTN